MPHQVGCLLRVDLLPVCSPRPRDRAPFVFTSDMAYVINGGDKPSSRFHDFVDLCCQAYNLIRKHTHLFLNLLGLVRSSISLNPSFPSSGTFFKTPLSCFRGFLEICFSLRSR